jgi:hypothetical protein
MVEAIILIVLGVVLLLNTLGVIDWNLWALLAQWWLLILIAIGLELLLNRRRGAAGLAVLVVGALVIAALALFGPTPQAASQTVSQALEEAERAEVHLTVGVAALRISALEDNDVLIEGVIELRRDEALEQDFEVRDDTAVFRLESRGPRVSVPLFGRQEGMRWDLQLNRHVPLVLEVDTGVGEVDLDLSALNLERLSLDTGVGRAVVRLPQVEQLLGEINTGVSETIVRIPQEAAARIHVSRGLGGVTVRGDFEHQDDVYESPGYATAEYRLELRLSTGVGSVTVEVY